ncbi:aromatic acid/H+ symport family MFS transporter [Rhodococcoides fascians A21d2]|uniref:MFS transporter n=1 Tax=Rhodococcoides fascians TaxID=1828 RepID=UPI0005614AB0|nr:aromatic acid/H+ symport family MFS transporter [Rhodococcus fascians]QII00311.1 aromatic acid/H+ symport family MFS transporter [Rhodococcus fascians A21d2]
MIVLLCFLTITFDGYDLVVYGTTVPSILAYEMWDVSPATAGLIGAVTSFGLLIGALASGALTSRFGARAVMIWSIVGFSSMMGFADAAPTPELFAFVRFLGGVGLGAVMPTAISLTVEYSRRERRQLNNALMFSGYAVGAILASSTAIIVLPAFGFRAMYVIGLIPLLLVPIIWRVLPESRVYLTRHGREEAASELTELYVLEPVITHPPEEGRGSAYRVLFSRTYALPLTLFTVATFCGLLVIYGVNTWLPNIMREAGYSLGLSLTFLATLNIGAIIGGVLGSIIADRIGSKPPAVVAFLIATTATVLLSSGLPTAGLFVVVAMLGMGTTGTQIIVAGWVATHFPESVRTGSIGFVLGIGRLGAILGPAIGGWITASALGYEWNYYSFAVFAAIGAASMLFMPRVRTAVAGATRTRATTAVASDQTR